MRFDLDDLNPAAWFEIEGDKDEGRVQVRACAGVDLETIIKEATCKRVEYKKHQRFEFVEADEAKHQEMLWDFCIVDWENINDAKGKAIPCTVENKLLLMKGSLPFSNFIGDCLEQISNDVQELKEVVEKNSKSSPSA